MNCVDFACKELGIEKKLIWSATKTKEVVAKRWTIICFLNALCLNYNEIGRKVNRNHQVVVHALKKATTDMKYVGRELACKYEALISPKMKVPNYKNSKIEVVNVR
jgi:chromosomal replication initiation ATPase DnaA